MNDDGGTGACSTGHLASGAASPENTQYSIPNTKCQMLNSRILILQLLIILNILTILTILTILITLNILLIL